MDTNILKYRAFDEIVRSGSFSVAAEALGVTQPSISRMISDLEKDMGFSLFERDRNGVVLTGEGQALLPSIRNLCDAMLHVKESVMEIKNLESGHLTIGVISSVAAHWIPNIVRKFNEEHPNIVYDLLIGDYSELREWVLDDTVDFAFTSMSVSEDLDTNFIETDEMMAVVPKDDPYADSEFYPMTELEKHPFMLMEKGGKAEMREFLDSEGLKPDIQFQTWDDNAILSMVEHGMGVSILHGLVLTRNPYDVKVLHLEHPGYRHLCVAKKKGKRLSLAAVRFMDFIKYRNGCEDE